MIFRNNEIINIEGNSFTSLISEDFCVLLDSANTLYSFSFNEQTGPAYFTNENNILIEVAHGTNLTNLTANFTTDSSAYAEINGITLESGVTQNDYSNLVTFNVIAENGTANTYIINVLEAVSVNELNNNNLIIYPNPNKGILYFSEPQQGKIQIFSITGQLISKIILNKNTLKINVSDLKNGFYIIKLENNNSIKYNKFEINN